MVHKALRERWVATTKENNLHFSRIFSPNHNQAHQKLNQKRKKPFHLWHNRVDSRLVDTDKQNSIAFSIYTLSFYSKAKWFSQPPSVKQFLFQNLTFLSIFQILAELLSTFCLYQRQTCKKMTTTLCNKLFYEFGACVCLIISTNFLIILFFMAIGFLMGLITISFALPIDLYNPLWSSE